jgi:BirA family biotin operon repressor/biotin-[acetyl-CoA-carboxylase] ligase
VCDLSNSSTGIKLHSYDSLDSTNNEVLRLIASGAASEGTVVVAKEQCAGRGRRNSDWDSPAGGLYMTLVTKVPNVRVAGQLAYVASLAVRDAVSVYAAASSTITCKWPNDLLLNGKKVSGILIETLDSYYAVGVGINLSLVPKGVADKAISLADLDLNVEPSEMLAGVLSSFRYWNQVWHENAFSMIRTAWMDAAHGVNEPIIVRFPDGTEGLGRFQGIDDEGALVLERVDGSNQKINAAEIIFSC